MKVIERHKGLAIIGGLSLILLFVMFLIFGRMLFSSSKTEYGDRLNGLVEIKKEETNKLIEEIKTYTEVKDISVRVQGKIIYITITYNDNVKTDTAKEIASKTISYYSEDVIKYYDFGYFLIQNKEIEEGEEDTNFRISGTKHRNSETISWTKN